jgi:hypothetical protein
VVLQKRSSETFARSSDITRFQLESLAHAASTGTTVTFLLTAVQTAAATFFVKNALGRPTNRAWPMMPLANAAVVIGL